MSDNLDNHQVFAFFDVDDTLIAVKSMFSFQEFWYCHYGCKEEQSAFEQDMQARYHKDACWKQLNKLYYQYYQGRSVEQVECAAREWFSELERKTDNLFYQPIVEKLRQHQRNGVIVVFVSGSCIPLMMPVASRLDVQEMLVTNLEVENGCYTGCIIPPQTIGSGKAEAINLFLASHNANAGACYAYGDDISDVPMLEAVGNAYAVEGGRGLEQYALKKGWPVLQTV